MCDVSITITANTAKTRKLLRTAWDEKVKADDEDELNLIDYLHPEKDCGIEVWDENYYGDEESIIVGQNELSLNGQVRWRPPIDFLQYLVDQGLSVSCEYHEGGLGFCGIWEDGEDEYYEYYDLLPEGWEYLREIDAEPDHRHMILHNPVWERGELIRLITDNGNIPQDEQKTSFGVLLNYEPFEFITPELPSVVVDAAGLDYFIRLDHLTMKKKVEIMMTGEQQPTEAIVYADEYGNNYLHIIE